MTPICIDCGEPEDYSHLAACSYYPRPRLAGVGKDAPVTANEWGGKQSDSPYFFRGLPPWALTTAAQILKDGSKYEPEDNRYADPTVRNWHKIEDWEHIEHALMHLVADLAGDTQDDHLGHALVRLMFAVHQRAAKKGVS